MSDAAGTAAPGQGAPAAGVQPGAPGQGDAQGQPTATGKGDGQQAFNWGLFPDVPEAQRELLEPHLRNVQGHVTRMEQQYSPYQPLVDTVDASEVSNLIGFIQAYQQDPVSTLLGMAQDLQSNGVLGADVDMNALAALVQGQAQQPGQGQPVEGEEIPPWAQQLIQKTEQQEAIRQQQEQAAQQTQLEQQQSQELEAATSQIRGVLTNAGIEEGLVSNEQIVAAIIANNGDVNAAAASITAMRDNFLGAFAKNNGGAKPPTVNGDLPQPPKAQKRGDGFDQARTGALQMLSQRMQADAQSQ